MDTNRAQTETKFNTNIQQDSNVGNWIWWNAVLKSKVWACPDFAAMRPESYTLNEKNAVCAMKWMKHNASSLCVQMHAALRSCEFLIQGIQQSLPSEPGLKAQNHWNAEHVLRMLQKIETRLKSLVKRFIDSFSVATYVSCKISMSMPRSFNVARSRIRLDCYGPLQRRFSGILCATWGIETVQTIFKPDLYGAVVKHLCYIYIYIDTCLSADRQGALREPQETASD